GTLQPVYSVGGSLTQVWMRKTIAQALTQFGAMIEEVLPYELVERNGLMARREAILHIHTPGDVREGQEARRRMVYEELFLFQLKLQAYRALSRSRNDGTALRIESETIRSFAATLPFELTAAQ